MQNTTLLFCQRKRDWEFTYPLDFICHSWFVKRIRASFLLISAWLTNIANFQIGDSKHNVKMFGTHEPSTLQDHKSGKKCVIGSKAWFLGRKRSAFLNRNRGHDKHSANGLMGSAQFVYGLFIILTWRPYRLPSDARGSHHPLLRADIGWAWIY